MKDLIEYKIQSRQKIHPEFKEVVKKNRPVFLKAKSELDEAEAYGKDVQALIQNHYPLVDKAQIEVMKETNRIAEHFSEDEHIQHKAYLCDQIGPLTWQAPLYERALIKPLGYPGDYEMMNLIYDEDPFKGPTAYFKMINALACRCLSGQATAERIPYFLKQMDEIGKEVLKKKDKFSVLNLACGPSKEIDDFIRLNPMSNQTEVHLVDQEVKAIEFSKKRLLDTIKQTKSTIKCFYDNKPLKDLFSLPDISFPQFDFIYSGGLFDYLNDAIFDMALLFLFKQLAKNGTMIIGNICPNDYTKICKWYLYDWPLVYRTQEELLEHANIIKEKCSIQVEPDKLGVFLFLKIKKS